MFSATPPRISTIGRGASALLLAVLAACGGGGSSSDTASSGTSQSEASATSSTSVSSGRAAAAAVDTAYRAAAGVVATTASAEASTRAYAASSGRRRTQAASDSTSVVLNCVNGGTATVTITGGTLETRLNGQLDAGERYELSFAACKVHSGVTLLDGTQLDGTMAMDVQTVGDTGTEVQMTFTALAVTLGDKSTSLDGDALVTASTTTADTGTTTTRARITTTSLSMITAWNSLSAVLTLTDADLNWSTTWNGSVPTSSSLAGQYTLSGTANDVTLGDTVAISSEITFDSDGTPSAGSWTSTDSQATIKTTASSTQITIEVDDGNDGSTDHTWTLTPPEWNATAR